MKRVSVYLLVSPSNLNFVPNVISFSSTATMDTHSYTRRKENPSFSSTLLDVISRSIDERNDRKPVRNRQSIDVCFLVDKRVPLPSSAGSRRNSATGLESNSFYIASNNVSSASSTNRPRPIRTNIRHDDECYNTQPEMNTNTSVYALSEDLKPKASCEGKTKSRAMKIYGYLKRGKQPMSPGSRLATFLYSLFSTTNTKKSKIPSAYNEAIVHANSKPKSAPNASTPSSLSRSCLSKTQSLSRGKLINGELKKHLAEKNRRIKETSMNILKNYQRKVEYVFDSIQNINVTSNDDDDDDDDEGSSYASSDLFELEHLSAIGMDGCMQELPLYETTSVDANRAIANGLLV